MGGERVSLHPTSWRNVWLPSNEAYAFIATAQGSAPCNYTKALISSPPEVKVTGDEAVCTQCRLLLLDCWLINPTCVSVWDDLPSLPPPPSEAGEKTPADQIPKSKRN